MAYERYTLRMKWEGVTGVTPTRWLSVRQTPYFKSEEEAEDYYERNRDFIDMSCSDREGAFHMMRVLLFRMCAIYCIHYKKTTMIYCLGLERIKNSLSLCAYWAI